MGVYINMEMPKNGSCIQIVIDDDGNVYPSVEKCILKMGSIAKATPVPPHGDLIDLKAPFEAQYYDDMTEEWIEKTVTVEDALYGCMVSDMPPVIIPADEGE